MVVCIVVCLCVCVFVSVCEKGQGCISVCCVVQEIFRV